MEHLNSSLFAAQINTPFQVDSGAAEPLAIELFEVTDRSDQYETEQFSLLFRGPLTPVLPQGIQALKHDQLGVLKLFLVPLGPDSHGMRYQAVFNRLKKRV